MYKLYFYAIRHYIHNIKSCRNCNVRLLIDVLDLVKNNPCQNNVMHVVCVPGSLCPSVHSPGARCRCRSKWPRWKTLSTRRRSRGGRGGPERFVNMEFSVSVSGLYGCLNGERTFSLTLTFMIKCTYVAPHQRIY